MFEAYKVFEQAMALSTGEKLVITFGSKARLMSARMQLTRMKGKYNTFPGVEDIIITCDSVALRLTLSKEARTGCSIVKLTPNGTQHEVILTNEEPFIDYTVDDTLSSGIKRQISQMLMDGKSDEEIFEFYSPDLKDAIAAYITKLCPTIPDLS